MPLRRDQSCGTFPRSWLGSGAVVKMGKLQHRQQQLEGVLDVGGAVAALHGKTRGHG